MLDKSALQEFENQVKKDIPLAEHLDFSIVEYELETLSLHAPFLKNKNDKQTVFAGSQASLALLAGWSLATLYFKPSGVSIVAAVDTEMHYKKPIENNFFAKARFEDVSLLESLKEKIQVRGKAKVFIHVDMGEIETQEIKATFRASYFVSL